jgi:tRNA nucleotidyltransferase (CCA-adding enzyme)
VKPALPEGIRRVAAAVRDAGGRALVVGGAVRDQLLGRTPSEFDLEVFGLAPERLRELLASLGSVDAVGQAFTVYKLAGLAGLAGAVDVSIPRRDSKAGRGHRGIAVVGDPSLSLEEAARRRDFTINAMLLDPFSGELVDPHGGRGDLLARVLRAVDPATFADDPLLSRASASGRPMVS